MAKGLAALDATGRAKGSKVPCIAASIGAWRCNVPMVAGRPSIRTTTGRSSPTSPPSEVGIIAQVYSVPRGEIWPNENRELPHNHDGAGHHVETRKSDVLDSSPRLRSCSNVMAIMSHLSRLQLTQALVAEPCTETSTAEPPWS